MALACGDLLVCVTLPVQVVAVTGKDGWPLPTWICNGISVTIFTSAGSSAVTLGLIAYNRWYLLTQPRVNFQRLYSTRNVCLMLCFAWIYPFLLTVVPHFAKLGRIGYSYKYKMCTHDNALPTSYYYSLIAGVGIIIPVFIAIVIIYIRIYIFVSRQNAKRAMLAITPVSTAGSTPSKVRECDLINVSSVSETPETDGSDESTTLPHHKQVGYIGNEHPNTIPTSITINLQESHTRKQNQIYQQHVKVTKRLAIVVFAYFLCFLPFGICVVVPPSDPGVPWTFWMTAISNCINPIIYARTMPVFREVMRNIIRCRLSSIPEPIYCIRRLQRVRIR